MPNSRNTSVINRRLVKNFRWMRSIGFTDLKFSGFFQSFFQLTFDLHIISFRSYVCLFSNRIRWKEGTGRTCPSALSHCTKDEDITFCQLCRSDPDDLLFCCMSPSILSSSLVFWSARWTSCGVSAPPLISLFSYIASCIASLSDGGAIM